MPGGETTFLVFVFAVLLSYVYAFVGGFTDAANAIATSVGTKAFTPTQAVLVAAVFELLGALTGTAVTLPSARGSWRRGCSRRGRWWPRCWAR